MLLNIVTYQTWRSECRTWGLPGREQRHGTGSRDLALVTRAVTSGTPFQLLKSMSRRSHGRRTDENALSCRDISCARIGNSEALYSVFGGQCFGRERPYGECLPVRYLKTSSFRTFNFWITSPECKCCCSHSCAERGTVIPRLTKIIRSGITFVSRNFSLSRT